VASKQNEEVVVQQPTPVVVFTVSPQEAQAIVAVLAEQKIASGLAPIVAKLVDQANQQ